MAKKNSHSGAVAIVGMACIYPGAPDLARYWENIVNGVDAIDDIPQQRCDPRYYDPHSTDADRFYCRRGGFVDAYTDFDAVKYGVMPRAAQAAEPDQLLALRVGIDALRDAGYDARPFPRERTGVIMGRGNYMSVGLSRLEQQVHVAEQSLQILKDLFPGISAAQLQEVRAQIKGRLDHYGPDVAIGMIPNLAASRLANRLDLHGPAYTVDAACASALLAIEQACDALRAGRCDMILAGGMHFSHDQTFWATFCQLGAFSRSQMIRPFSENADGILAGEGIGILVLKRQADAERDGDRIYALIHGVASSSDGRGGSLMAPAVSGQLLALERAWAQTGLERGRIGLIEAHGTGTPAGDTAELETLKAFFGDGRMVEEGQRPVLGSVKSMIGHTMPAAGVAGVIKAALAVYHGVLPPTLHCETPHAMLAETRFRVLADAVPWVAGNGKRIAGVNAFGFGGINAHVVLGAHREDVAPMPACAIALPDVVTIATESLEELQARLRQRRWDARPVTGRARWRLAIVEPNEKRLDLAARVVAKGLAWHGRNQIYFSGDGMIAAGGKIAFLFPGVDSSFEPRVGDVADYFRMPLPEFCRTFDPAESLREVVLGVDRVNALLFAILGRLGIRPDGMAGHSIGEFSAMAASGMLPRERAAAIMATLENDPASLNLPDVVFLAAACAEDVARRIVEDVGGGCISHDNCPHQVILCGTAEAIDTLQQRLRAANILAQRLPFASGFHSPMFAGHMQPYRDFYAATDLHEPVVPVWSATTGQPFPSGMQAKKDLALAHLVEPVRFRMLIDNMHAAGYRAFIQVGTGSLPGFVGDILKNRPHCVIAANLPNRSGMAQLCHLVAALWIEGAAPDVSLLGGGSAGKSTPLKLRLGVPLVNLEHPLSGGAALLRSISAPVSESDSDDPLREAFSRTLECIRQASEEVEALWLARRSGVPAPVATPAAAPLPGAFTQRIVRRLDVDKTIPLVMDHALYPQRAGWPDIADWHPVVPLTMEIALLRAAIEEMLPGFVVVRFEDIHAFNWLVVDRPVDATIHLASQGGADIEAGIDGYMKARAVVARAYPEPVAELPEPLENPRAAAVDAHALYAGRWMFHGPAYQGVRRLGPIADNGMCGQLTVAPGPGALLDNMGQLAGYWVMEQESNCLAMPISLGRLDFFAPEPPVDAMFECQVRIRHLDESSCRTDLQLFDGQGRLVIAMRDWQTRRYRMSRDFFLRTKLVQCHTVCEALEDGVMLFRDEYDTALVREYAARRYLNRQEMAEYETVSPRRRRQWLNGRIAAKDAVRRHLWNTHGHSELYPKALSIRNDERGQPHVDANIDTLPVASLHLSIAHKDLLAVAIAAATPVGVDIEKIEARSPAFIDLAFSEGEQELLAQCDNSDGMDGDRDEWVARFWVAKEALAKRRGTGLEGNPKQFHVEGVDGRWLVVDGCRVATCTLGDYVIGWTV